MVRFFWRPSSYGRKHKCIRLSLSSWGPCSSPSLGSLPHICLCSPTASPITVGDPWAVLIVSFEVTRVGEEVGVQGCGRESKSLLLRILSSIGTVAPERPVQFRRTGSTRSCRGCSCSREKGLTQLRGPRKFNCVHPIGKWQELCSTCNRNREVGKWAERWNSGEMESVAWLFVDPILRGFLDLDQIPFCS